MGEGSSREIANYGSKELRAGDEPPSIPDLKRDYDVYVEDEFNLRDYVDILFRRKWVILLSLLVSVLVVSLYCLTATRVYKAEAKIEISPENPKVITFEEVIALEPHQREFYETQFQLIKSRSLAKEVVETLNLGSYPEFKSEIQGNGGIISSLLTYLDGLLLIRETATDVEMGGGDAKSQEKLIDSLLARVDVKPDRRSRLVEISFESSDPKLSALVVNTLVDEYIDWMLDRKLVATKSARAFLERQLEQAKAKLEKAEEELNKFAKDMDIVSLDENLNLVYKQLAELNKASSEAETERLSKEALFKEVLAGNYSYLPQVMTDPTIQALNEELSKLRSRYDNESVIYGPNYPDIKQLAAQIKRIEDGIKRRADSIAESIRKDYQAAQRKEDMLRKRAEEQKKRVTELNERTIQYKILEREVETNKSIYQNLLQRLKETEVTSGIRATNIQVVDYATVPLSPFKPNVKLNLLLALMLGLVGGVSLAVGLEQLDGTIKDEEEVKKRFSVPFLGVVPLANSDDCREVEKATIENPHSLVAEAFRVIRTSIIYSFADHAPKSLLVTSTQPLEGKTTAASNISLSMVQSGLRVLLIDADLRKPRLHKLFLSGDNLFGLSTYLVGRIELEGVIKETNVAGLDIIPSGPIPPNPAELLGSSRMKELIELARGRYDHVVVDAPPVSCFADSRLISRVVDGVIIVTSVGITQRKVLQSSIEEIVRVRGKIIGAIINRLATSRGRYGYYYYYGEEKVKERPKITLPRS